jgi:hypothetical protein
MYTIGMGPDLNFYLPEIASTGNRVLKHIAMATNGRCFIAPTKTELKTAYQKISDELHRPATYYIKPSFAQGQGFVSVVSTGEKLNRAVTPRVELVLDGSGSMRESKRKIGGKLKIDVAKEVIREIVENLPDDVELALRVYGHRIREGRKGDCKDSELVVPFGKLNKKKVIQRVNNLTALGTTPIAYSLGQAAADFPKDTSERFIILVTDGKEECGGDPAGIAKDLKRKGINIRVNVVGFALAEERTKQDMRRVAEITGGRFFDAQDRTGLHTSMQSALAVPFDVIDGESSVVASGLTGQGAVRVPEGIYDVIIRGTGKPIVVHDVQIIRDQFCRLQIRKEGQEIGTMVVGPMTREASQKAAAAGPVIERVVYIEKEESLGIHVQDVEGGLRIDSIEADSVGDFAGLMTGDLITHIDENPVKGEEDLLTTIHEVSVGERKQSRLILRCGLDVVALVLCSKTTALKPHKPSVETKPGHGLGSRVMNVQKWLKQMGFDPGPVDGLWGKKTANAMMEFQKWYPRGNLAATGKLDEPTYVALQEAATHGLKRDQYKKPSRETDADKKRDEGEARRRAEQSRKEEELRNAEEERKNEERRRKETEEAIKKSVKQVLKIFN